MNPKKFLLILILFFIPLSFISGQAPIFDPNTNLPTGIVEQISTTVLPSVPQPGENVSVTVESFSTNLDKADFIWKVNGTTVESGKGIRTFNFTAPQSGQKSVIDLTIVKEEGGTLNRTFEFAPADIDLLYEADTYTHPYYKGKALYTSESEARIIALPNFIENGRTIPAGNLVYKWSLNGTVDQTGSGYGRNTYLYKGGIIQRPVVIQVEVSAENSALTGKEAILLEAQNPDLVIYENNPIYGVIFEKAIQGNFILDKPEIELEVIPYNFSTKQKTSPSVGYTWLMNGEAFVVDQNTNTVVLRNETGEEGRAVVSIEAEHFDNILQIARTGIELLFESHSASFENDFEF